MDIIVEYVSKKRQFVLRVRVAVSSLPKWTETKTVLAHLIKVDHNHQTQTAYNQKLAHTYCTFVAAVFKDVSTDMASALQPFCASNLPEQCNLNLSPFIHHLGGSTIPAINKETPSASEGFLWCEMHQLQACK